MPRAGREGGGVQSETGLAVIHLDFKQKMCCFSCMGYLVFVKPRLRGWGATCSHHNDEESELFRLFDSVFLCSVLFLVAVAVVGCGFPVSMPSSRAYCLSRLYKLAVAVVVTFSSFGMGWRWTFDGACGLGELLRYGVPLALVVCISPRVSKDSQTEAKQDRFEADVENTLKTMQTSKVATLRRSGHEMVEMCTICMSEWESQDIVKVPACKHTFHLACLHTWLGHQTRSRLLHSCPMCRQLFSTVRPDPAINRTSPLTWLIRGHGADGSAPTVCV